MRNRGEEQRVAVGRGFRHILGGDGAARADAILDDELLPECSGEPGGKDSRLAVGVAAGGEREDELHRTLRPALRLKELGRERGDDGQQLQKVFHFLSGTRVLQDFTGVPLPASS